MDCIQSYLYGGVISVITFSQRRSDNERRWNEFDFDIGLSTLEEVKKSMSMTEEYGRAKFSEGVELGRTGGREERNIEIAKIMLSTGSGPEYVATCTGLSREEILRLRNGTD